MTRLIEQSSDYRCPTCKRLLAKRIQLTTNGEKQTLIHVKHRKIDVMVFQAFITCPNCKTMVRVDYNSPEVTVISINE